MTGRYPCGRQAGSALLAILLVGIVAASFILVSKLNSSVRQYVRQSTSSKTLAEARAALIGYAVNYPEHHPGEGPGYLPCPDINNNGSAGGSCSLGGGTSLGRLPWKTLEIEELRDHVGERLWYAVADNYKNNPKVLASLNPDSPGNFSVNGNNDIVAVIIAPGEPVGSQDRGSNPLDVNNYLEDDNADLDADFVTRASGEFNDQVVFITRDELIDVVQKRVLGDVKHVLLDYESVYGAYPWLTPFGDPRASSRNLNGSHNGSDNAATLTDSTVDFTDWNIQSGDTVINVTDGSVGTVSAVTSTTLSLAGLNLGIDNDFDDGDDYAVLAASNAGLLSGTATSGTGGLVVKDFNQDFVEIGISPGDIIDNLSDGSSGMIESVDSTSITVASLSGGTSNTFVAGQNYQVRSNRGIHTGSNNSADLNDSTVDFNVMGVRAGDLVVNLTDGSMGRVDTAAANTLTMDTLYFGTDNDFDNGDLYIIPRYNTDNATREGLLSLHEPGKYYETALAMDWSTLSSNGVSVSTSVNANYPHSSYLSDLSGRAQSSGGITGTINVDIDHGQCIWVVRDVADCRGVYPDPAFPVQGTVTSGFNTYILTDANADFVYTAVKRGDIVRNFDDEIYTSVSGTATSGSNGEILEDTSKNFIAMGVIPYYHFIHNADDNYARGLVTEVIDANTIRVEAFAGRPAMDMDPGETYYIFYPQQIVVTGRNSATQLTTATLNGSLPDLDAGGAGAGGAYQEFYQINVATGRTPTRTVDAYYAPGTYLVDSGADFSDVEVGDIVENITDNAFGVITYVDAVNDWLYAQLYAADGSTRSFNGGETYRIYYDHDVNTRRYDFHARFSGTANVHAVNKLRKRDVCLGYSSDCSTAGSNVALPQQGSFVLIRDFDINGNVVASATVDIPAAGAQGRVRVADTDYYLSAGDTASDDLPSWFVKNKWQQYVYADYANGFIPGGTGSCTAGTDCLEVGGSLGTDDTEALVLSAGRFLESGICQADGLPQDRGKGRLCDYFEDENATDGDDTFRKDSESGDFNDKLMVVSPPQF